MVVSTNPTEPPTGTTRYQKALGILIWAAFGAVGIGVLYWFSILSGDNAHQLKPRHCGRGVRRFRGTDMDHNSVPCLI